jgi:hypothetical protein
LGEIVGRLSRSRRYKLDVPEGAFVLVANRLCEPRSEHGLARWLEHTFVCDTKGKRWKPDWLPDKQITKQQRVKVKHEQLKRWMTRSGSVSIKRTASKRSACRSGRGGTSSSTAFSAKPTNMPGVCSTPWASPTFTLDISRVAQGFSTGSADTKCQGRARRAPEYRAQSSRKPRCGDKLEIRLLFYNRLRT